MKKIFLSSLFAVIFAFVGAHTTHASIGTTVTCYNTCSKIFSSHVGTVILNLQCNATSPTSYTGSLRVNGKSLSYSKSCPPPALPPSLTFTASAKSITLGESANLIWEVKNTSSCTAYGGWSGSKKSIGRSSQSVSPVITTTYALECWNSSGVSTGRKYQTISVSAPVAYSCTGSLPSGATRCSGDTIGLSSNISWRKVTSCTSARKCEYTVPTSVSYSCTGSLPSNANKCPSDTIGLSSNVTWKAVTGCTNARKCEYVVAWTPPTTFSCDNAGPRPSGTIMCPNDDTGLTSPGTWWKVDTCTNWKKCEYRIPTPTPTVSLTANPTTIPSGGSANLTWTSTNATKCIATGGWSGDRITGDTESVSPSSDTTYYIRCINESTGVSSVTRHATVNVLEPLSVSLSNNRGTTANIGEDVTWTAAITGGQTPYSNYSWSGDTSATPSNFSNGSKVTEYYTTLGRKDVTFSVEDSTGTEVSDSDFIDIEDNRKLQ